MITTGVIVRFNELVESLAGQFCYRRSMTGKVVGWDKGRYIIDYGLPYPLFAPKEHLVLVATESEIPDCCLGD